MADPLLTLDPSLSASADAVREALYACDDHGPEVLHLARRAATDAPDPLLRADALNVLGKDAALRRDDPEASRRFRAALELSWGTEWRTEIEACINLAMISARNQRIVESVL